MEIIERLPVLLFALGAVLLWSRCRGFATLLMALGFVVALLCLAAEVLVRHDIQTAVLARQDPFQVVQHYHALTLLTRHGTTAGLWVASVGLIWHACAKRDARVS